MNRGVYRGEPKNNNAVSFGITINGLGGTITTGVAGYLMIPYDCIITGWSLVANASGSIVIDVWKDTYGNFPPTSADTITGTELPTLTSQQTNRVLSLSTWSNRIQTGDYLAFNVNSATTVTSVVLTLRGTKLLS